MQGNITDEDIKYGFNLHIVQPMQLMMIQYYYISVCKVLCTWYNIFMINILVFRSLYLISNLKSGSKNQMKTTVPGFEDEQTWYSTVSCTAFQ